jgi:hypothetical protein
MNMKFKNLMNAGICVTLLCGASGAWAGQLTGLTAVKKIVKVGEDVNLVATGTAQCGVMVNDGNGKSWAIALTDTKSPATKSFGASYNKPGKFHLMAVGKGGMGPSDCNSNPVMAVDITVLGAPPECTFDMALQKDYQAIGIQVKTCEVSSKPPVAMGTHPEIVQTTGVAGSTQPGLTVAHTKITSMQVSDMQLKTGGTLTVKVNGTGNEAHCPTTIAIGHNGSNYWKSTNQASTGGWPRVSTYVLPEAGKYLVRIAPMETANLSAAEKTACGFNISYNNSGIPGDFAQVEVTDIPK